MAGFARPHEIVTGDGWFVARYHRVHCTYVDPSMSEAGFYALTEQLARDIENRRPNQRIGVLYYTPENAAMDSPRRRHLAKLLKEREEMLQRTTAAYALATHSPFIRGVLSTLFWMAPPGYPHKVVATPRQGLEFIASELPRFDPADICSSFEALIEEQGGRLREAS